MTRATFIRPLGAVAATGLVVCALEVFSGAAAGADAGAGESGPIAASPDTPPAPGSTPDGGTRADRKRLRHQKRFGVPQAVDGGSNTDAGPPRDAGLARFAFRDGGMHPMVLPPRPPPPPIAVPPPPPPPPPPPTPTGPSTSLPVTELGFNTCRKIASGKRAVKVNLKPDVELPELVAWISSITCKSFVLPGHLSAGGKKITFVTQGMMTPNEAYAAFLSALDSVGLTVERGPGYYKIIETAKAKTGAVPVYGFDGQPARPAPKRSKPAPAD